MALLNPARLFLIQQKKCFINQFNKCVHKGDIETCIQQKICALKENLKVLILFWEFLLKRFPEMQS